jgi:acetyltransferase-like isoleucine patch superfamily enzyme
MLRILGHWIKPGVKIGFSLVLVDHLYLEALSNIGHLNLIRCRRVVLGKTARIGNMNLVRGPFSVWIGEGSKLGNRNQVTRAPHPVSYGPALLKFGKVSGITAQHSVDCTCSVILGDYTTIAGQGSQFWTHGYYHCAEGVDRFRVDGKIRLGNNVYIGSASVITAGVEIANHVIVGSHSSISKSLSRSGMYVSQPLRYIELDLEKTIEQLEPVTEPCVDRVYRKKRNG